jgi:ABC-type multidrug transport system fused ATPase/permease subunit
MYISVYGMLAILGSALWALCMWLVFCRIVPETSSRLHEYLVIKIKEASLSFLTSTDNGITLNLFSQDMTLIDRSLPADFLKTTNNFVQCLMSAVFISVGAKYLAPLIPVAGFVVYLIQKFYLRTSRQLRQLDLETKSPLYTQFTETISGLTTIRAFGWQQHLKDEHQKLLQISQRPFFTLFVVQRWLILVLDLFVAGVAIMLCILAVFVPNIGPIGVSLISLVTFSQQLAELINFWTSMETSIGAVTRIRDFQNNVPSENLPGEDQIPPPTWPSEGRLVFRNVSSGYSMTSQPVLRNISLTVDTGTKLGICGRTGSGKSSLVLAILRMIEVQTGELTIDGVDLVTCPRETVRNKVTVIPQEPVLVSSKPVRDNLTGFTSPAGTTTTAFDDSAILGALEKAQLREYVESCPGSLNARVDDIALSAGQKQLLCLARAILMKRKILLLDEATSNVDEKTDELMQKVIRTEFSDCTIIAIAHRVNNLIDFDMIAVVDEGRIVEYDSPGKLLSHPESLFRHFYDIQTNPCYKD